MFATSPKEGSLYLFSCGSPWSKIYVAQLWSHGDTIITNLLGILCDVSESDIFSEALSFQAKILFQWTIGIVSIQWTASCHGDKYSRCWESEVKGGSVCITNRHLSTKIRKTHGPTGSDTQPRRCLPSTVCNSISLAHTCNCRDFLGHVFPARSNLHKPHHKSSCSSMWEFLFCYYIS